MKDAAGTCARLKTLFRDFADAITKKRGSDVASLDGNGRLR